MGFGIALLGYAFLIMNEIGGAIIAAPVIAYGLFLASRLEKRFLYASVSVLFMLPRGVVNLLSAIGIIDLPKLTALNTVTFILYLISWAAMSYFFLTAVIHIAADCNAEKLKNQARNRLCFTLLFIFASLFLFFAKAAGIMTEFDSQINMLQYIFQYAVILVNLLFMHTCFILITSEKKYEQDLHDIAEERAKSLEKRHNDESKEATLYERRRKK